MKSLREQEFLFTEKLVLWETMGSGIVVEEALGSGRGEIHWRKERGCEARLGQWGKEGPRYFWKEEI